MAIFLAERTAEKLVEAASEGRKLTITEAARQVGASVSYAQNGTLVKAKSFQAVIAKWREPLAKKLMQGASHSFSEVNRRLKKKTTIKDISTRDLIAGGAVMFDKAQLLTGGPTQRVETLGAFLLKYIESEPQEGEQSAIDANTVNNNKSQQVENPSVEP